MKPHFIESVWHHHNSGGALTFLEPMPFFQNIADLPIVDHQIGIAIERCRFLVDDDQLCTMFLGEERELVGRRNGQRGTENNEQVSAACLVKCHLERLFRQHLPKQYDGRAEDATAFAAIRSI